MRGMNDQEAAIGNVDQLCPVEAGARPRHQTFYLVLALSVVSR